MLSLLILKKTILVAKINMMSMMTRMLRFVHYMANAWESFSCTSYHAKNK